MQQMLLHERHRARGGVFAEFAGYDMVLYYTKPIEEHNAVRNAMGLFDISHMGQFVARGPRTASFLQYALTNNVDRIGDGEAQYSPLCREDGGILDDLIVYRFNTGQFRIIVNAANREKDYAWLAAMAADFGVTLDDITPRFALFAIQGPQAFARLSGHIDPAPHTLAYYAFAEAKGFGTDLFMARTGYTGEPGVEIAVPENAAGAVWDELTGALGAIPIGLAARDSLRLEACMSLYGNELLETRHPFESGVGWAVDLDNADDFCGKAALLEIKQEGPGHALVGLELTERGIARGGYPLLSQGRNIGVVTSGVRSPTMGKSVALAHVEKSAAAIGTELQVEIRGKAVNAVTVKRPFYRNPALRA